MTIPSIASRSLVATKIKTDALLLPVYEDALVQSHPDCSQEIRKQLKSILASGDFTGRHGQTYLLPMHAVRADRILLLGLGRQPEVTAERLRQAGAKAAQALAPLKICTLALAAAILNDLPEQTVGPETPAYYLLEGALLRRYRFRRYVTRDTAESENSGSLKSVAILGERTQTDVRLLSVAVEANTLVRDLVLTPANHLTPSDLAQAAKNAAGPNVRVRVLDRKAIVREGMGAFLSVSQGSREEPKLIVMEYNGAKGAPVAVVGKAITFDSGGISLKPSDGMEKMKYDMAGGAAVIGLMQALGRLKVKCNVVGIVPATENLPGGRALRPGDVVTSLSGKTIEIISTDAEGRLIVADAITYALKHFRPCSIIDIATLTGACSIALGQEAIAMMGNDVDLLERLKRSGAETHERVWEMPLYDEFRDHVKGDISDIKNAGGRKGSLIAAAYFLKEFVGDTPWAHLDIAGTAWVDKDKPYFAKGATGIGVRLLLNLFRAWSDQKNQQEAGKKPKPKSQKSGRRSR